MAWQVIKHEEVMEHLHYDVVVHVGYPTIRHEDDEASW
jgi:hypothetical protein